MAIQYDGTDNADVNNMIYRDGTWYYELQSSGPSQPSRWVPYGQGQYEENVISRIPKPQKPPTLDDLYERAALQARAAQAARQPVGPTIVQAPFNYDKNPVDGSFWDKVFPPQPGMQQPTPARRPIGIVPTRRSVPSYGNPPPGPPTYSPRYGATPSAPGVVPPRYVSGLTPRRGSTQDRRAR